MPRLLSRRMIGTASAVALAVGAGVTLTLTSTAGAAAAPSTAVVADNGRELAFTAGSGQANEVTVTNKKAGAEKITFIIDDVATIEPGNGCGHPDSGDDTKVSCTLDTPESQSPYDYLTADTGDGDDTVTFDNAAEESFLTARFLLGDGKDEMSSISKIDASFVHGEEGDDTIKGGAYSVVQGGDGDDTIDTTGDIADGGTGDDEITGGPSDQKLKGDDGDDTIHGGDGGDLLYGGKDNDVLYGEEGADQLYGNSGDDKLYGGPDEDTLSGGPGEDEEQQD